MKARWTGAIFAHPSEAENQQKVVDAVTARLSGNTRYFITLHRPDGMEVARANLGDTIPRSPHLEWTGLGAGVVSAAYVHGPGLKVSVPLTSPYHLSSGQTLGLDLNLELLAP